MPGRVFLTAPIAELAAALGVSPAPVADEAPRQNIAPGQEVVALTSEGLSRMRWGMIPVGRVNARGRPVMETIINARSETLFDKSAYAGTGRAVMPVNGWYEWTGERRRKTPWRITPQDGGFLWFAAITDIWTAPGGTRLHQLAAVTCEPSADVRDIHHRMAVILETVRIPLWLSGSPQDVAALMRPWPDGSLRVEEATNVNWEDP
ncbi:SOS response-associated peptidase [Aestuariivita sp.]|jgi:putative SOS response-associated peptidase YedK|uniref:SOS response-associated peptidase n=1 Tax=Aestuariivita sp. TaxID=1872407 RepID=UPI00216E82B2|nr:SOS response-associated peptidase [Aestuariivita sp.]MCE8008399.1 SOS response-associated peptidase [Aestuariivita sp.]